MDIGPNQKKMDIVFPQDDPSELSQLMKKAFGNDLIMREILNHALRHNVPEKFQPTPQISRSKARNFRLVSKEFLDHTNNLFEDRLVPLFSFKYDMFSDTNNIQLRATKFANFQKGLDEGSVENPPPPFSISITGPSNCKSKDQCPLLDSLFSAQNTMALSLVRLGIIWWPIKPFKMPVIPLNMKLPCLREFKFLENGTSPISPQYRINTFIQSIFNASVILKKLEWFGSTRPNPNECMNFTFPTTLRCLELHFKTLWNSVIVKSLVWPSLRELNLRVFSNDLPQNRDLGDDIQKKMDRSFPKLDKLVLHLPSSEELEVWCGQQWNGWPAIKTLSLDGTEPIRRQLMARVHRSFTGVVNLELEFRGFGRVGTLEGASDRLTSGLRYIFDEIRHLKSLKLCVFNKLIEWDLLLAGIETKEEARRLGDPTPWDGFCGSRVEGQGQGDGVQKTRLSSIRDLQQLEELHICEHVPEWYLYIKEPTTVPLMSELVFRLGFMRMPKLKRLVLGFQDLEMDDVGEEWLEQGPGRSFRLGKKVKKEVKGWFS